MRKKTRDNNVIVTSEAAEGEIITIESENRSKNQKLICLIVCILIAAISFFVAGELATSIENYDGTLQTLNHLQKQALGLTATSTALATGAAAIPGDATTPIANKLADVAGYMVIIYVAIIFEKYLLTIMGFLAFKVLIPVGMGMQAVRNILGKEKDSALHKLSLRLMLLGILFWLLVPTSAIVTNMINDTYQESKAVGYEILEDTGIDEDDVAALEEEMSETEADSEDGESKSIFAVGEALGSLADKIGGTAKSVGKAASDKIDQFQNALNQLIEAVAVMIVTTCVIPIAVLIAFILIMNAVMGLSVPIPTALPKASKLIKRKSDSEISESSD